MSCSTTTLALGGAAVGLALGAYITQPKSLKETKQVAIPLATTTAYGAITALSAHSIAKLTDEPALEIQLLFFSTLGVLGSLSKTKLSTPEIRSETLVKEGTLCALVPVFTFLVGKAGMVAREQLTKCPGCITGTACK